MLQVNIVNDNCKFSFNYKITNDIYVNYVLNSRIFDFHKKF